MRAHIVIGSVLLCLSVAAMADSFGSGENQFEIDLVPISGDTNPSSTIELSFTSFEGVSADYRMGIYEVTNDQWAKFEASLGVPVTSNWADYAGNNGPFYSGANMPATNVSWFEAAQFVNWLNASSGYHEAYKFTGTQGTSDYTYALWSPSEAADLGTNLYRHRDAVYFLPNSDEWIKAAYWNGSELQDYATASGEVIYQGDGTNGGWNYRGYDNDIGPDGPAEGAWEVGSGSEELNGTFDMMGNLSEVLENAGTEADLGYQTDYDALSSRWVIGGSSSHREHELASDSSGRWGMKPWGESVQAGFRIAARVENTADAHGAYVMNWQDQLVLQATWASISGGEMATVLWDLDGDGIFETNAQGLSAFAIDYAYLHSLGLMNGGQYDIYVQITDTLGYTDVAASTLAIVPEPATMGLLAVGGLALLRRRRVA